LLVVATKSIVVVRWDLWPNQCYQISAIAAPWWKSATAAALCISADECETAMAGKNGVEKGEDEERPPGEETQQRQRNILGEEKPNQLGYIYSLRFKTHGLGQVQ